LTDKGVDGDGTLMTPYPIIARENASESVYTTWSGPGTVYYEGKVWVAIRVRDPGPPTYDSYRDRVRLFTLSNGASKLQMVSTEGWRNWKAWDMPAMIVFRGVLYVFMRGETNWVDWVRYNSADRSWTIMSRVGAEVHHTREPVVHQDRLWLVMRGTNGHIWNMNWDGKTWTKNEQLSAVSPIAPGVASHDGKLVVLVPRYQDRFEE
jgi:hypothetical protein